MAEIDVKWIEVDEEFRSARERMTVNVALTGHPYHHLTRSGVIVNDDPRAHVMHEERLWEAGIDLGIPKSWKHPRKAVPRVEDWYATKAGRKWLSQQSTAGIVEAVPVQRPLFL